MMPLLVSLLILAAEPRVRLQGDVKERLAFTNAELQRRFATEIKEVAFTEKGVAGRAHAFPLLSLLRAAGPKVDPRRKHGPLAFAVVAEGEDG